MTNNLYRIYVENTGRREIAETVSKYFKGFTVLDSMGYFNGVPEKSLVIEIMAPESYGHVVRFLGKLLAQVGNQECVLVVAGRIKGEFVHGS